DNCADVDEFSEDYFLSLERKSGIETKVDLNFLKTLETLLSYVESENPDLLIPELFPASLSIPDILRGLSLFVKETLQGGRTRKQLLILFAIFFLHNPANYDNNQNEINSSCLAFAENLTKAFMLGQKEKQFFELVCAGYWGIASLSQEAEVNALQIYRYFKRVGACGVE